MDNGDQLLSLYLVYLKYFENDSNVIAHELGHILFHSTHNLSPRKFRKQAMNLVLGSLHQMNIAPWNIMNAKSSTMLENASVSKVQCERARIYLKNKKRIISHFERNNFKRH